MSLHPSLIERYQEEWERALPFLAGFQVDAESFAVDGKTLTTPNQVAVALSKRNKSLGKVPIGVMKYHVGRFIGGVRARKVSAQVHDIGVTVAYSPDSTGFETFDFAAAAFETAYREAGRPYFQGAKQ